MIIRKSSHASAPLRRAVKKLTKEELQAMFAGMGPMPGKGPENAAESLPLSAAIEVIDGTLTTTQPNIYGGSCDAAGGEGLHIVSYSPNVGGIYLKGKKSNYTLENAYIYVDGDSPEHNNAEGGKYCAAYADEDSTLTIRNSILYANGCERDTLVCSVAELYVYDSIIGSHGHPYGDDLPEGVEDKTVTKGSLLAGNTRTFCALGESKSYFYNSTITADGWGALSTDHGGTGLYMEANDCRIITSKSGYGSYADGSCTDVFRRCDFDCASMSIILAGECHAEFEDCKSKNGAQFAVIYCVHGTDAETAELDIRNSNITSKEDCILVKSANSAIHIQNSSLRADNGVLVRSVVNEDEHATKVTSDSVYGVDIYVSDSQLDGDFIREDTDRDMYLHLENAIVSGAMKQLTLYMSENASWKATENSEVYLGTDIDISQLDACTGVTITVHGDVCYTATLPSGGQLHVITD